MAYTESTMLPLGIEAPDFKLTDVVSGKKMSFEDIEGEMATVVAFICNHCPYVKHINPVFTATAAKFKDLGVGFVAISSNDVEHYPQDSPEKMAEVAKKEGYTFPYLYDDTQVVARSYHAVCTPEFYVFDRNRRLVYRGQLDDSRPGNDIEVSGEDLIGALDALLRGEHVSTNQKPGGGCNIKWKKDMDPNS